MPSIPPQSWPWRPDPQSLGSPSVRAVKADDDGSAVLVLLAQDRTQVAQQLIEYYLAWMDRI